MGVLHPQMVLHVAIRHTGKLVVNLMRDAIGVPEPHHSRADHIIGTEIPQHGEWLCAAHNIVHIPNNDRIQVQIQCRTSNDALAENLYF